MKQKVEVKKYWSEIKPKTRYFRTLRSNGDFFEEKKNLKKNFFGEIISTKGVSFYNSAKHFKKFANWKFANWSSGADCTTRPSTAAR